MVKSKKSSKTRKAKHDKHEDKRERHEKHEKRDKHDDKHEKHEKHEDRHDEKHEVKHEKHEEKHAEEETFSPSVEKEMERLVGDPYEAENKRYVKYDISDNPETNKSMVEPHRGSDKSGRIGMNRKITIQFNLRSIMMFLFFFLLLLSSFMLGKYYFPADCDIIGSSDGALTAASTVETEDDTASADAEETGVDTSAEADAEEDTTAEDNQALIDELTNSSDAAATTSTTPYAPEEDEAIVKTYKSVNVVIEDIVKDWKGSWGKVKRVEFKIANSEAGKILPHKAEVNVEGYDIMHAKEADLSKVGYIGKGKTASLTRTFDVSYSGSEARDVTIKIYDEDGKLMASASKQFSLGP